MSLLRKPWVWIVFFLALYAAVQFRAVWPAHTVIQSQDYNYGLAAFYEAEMPGSLTRGFWRSAPLLGRVGHMPPTWTNLLLAVLPPEPFMDVVYGLNLFLASCFLVAFLRRRGLGWTAAVCGALTAFWLGSNLTLILPGHLEKYAVLLFASITLYSLERTLDGQCLRWSLISGGSLGMMFLHQPDVALFFGLLLGAYFLHGLLTRVGPHPRALVRCALPLWLPALLLVGNSYRHAMETQVRNVPLLQQGSEEEQWNFTTQWSWPPGESLDLVAPGYFGWHSGHAEAPYHGIMGRDARFDTEGVGLRNFKLESQYLGILPFAFALLALFGLFRGPDRGKVREIGFWGGAVLLTFLLACGKFTPLYRLFQLLPLVDSIRNPNKFLQVFQVALGVLTAYGIDAWARGVPSRRIRRLFAGAMLAVAVAAGIGAAVTDPGDPGDPTQRRALEPYNSQAAALLANRRRALLHLALFAGAGAGLLLISSAENSNRRLAVALIPLLAVDGLLLGRIYLQSSDISFLKNNPMAEHLQTHRGVGRVAVMGTSWPYGFYLTHLLPAHHVPFANISVAPRLEREYEHYFKRRVPDPAGMFAARGASPLHLMQGAWIFFAGQPPLQSSQQVLEMGVNQFRYWRDFGVNHVLTNRQLADFLKQWPERGNTLQEVYAYEVIPLPNGGLGLRPRKNGSHVVLRLNRPDSRFSLLSKWDETPEDYTVPDTWTPQGGGRVISAIPNPTGFRLRVEVSGDGALLRLADRYSPDLRLWMGDGEPIPLRPVDGLFAGAVLPGGIHDLTLGFQSPSPGRTLQGFGLALALLALCLPPGLRLARHVLTENDPDGLSNRKEAHSKYI